MWCRCISAILSGPSTLLFFESLTALLTIFSANSQYSIFNSFIFRRVFLSLLLLCLGCRVYCWLNLLAHFWGTLNGIFFSASKISLWFLGVLDHLTTAIWQRSRVCWNSPYVSYHLQILSTLLFYFLIYGLVKFCYSRVPGCSFFKFITFFGNVLWKLLKAKLNWP